MASITLLRFALALALLGGASSLFAQAKTRVHLHLNTTQAKAGSEILADIELQHLPDWHTYWRYPGEDGLGTATKIRWTLPEGWTVGDIEWPLPEKHQDKVYFTHVLSGETHLLVPIRIGANAKPGPIELAANVRWLECQVECVPGSTNITTSLQIGPEEVPAPSAQQIAARRNAVPKKLATAPPIMAWEGPAQALAEGGEKRPLIMSWSPPSQNGFDFFPYENTAYRVGVNSEAVPVSQGMQRIRKWVFKDQGEWPATLTGVISPISKDGKPEVGGGETTVTISTAEPPKPVAAPLSIEALLLQLFSAFVGGLILNIMPCVLPVLALKILGFVNQAKNAPRRVRKLGLVYGLGVLVSFLVLAGVAIGIQKAGGVAGWSAPFQNPVFRVVITTLLLLVSLNLFGVFEVVLASRATETAAFVASRHGASGAFFNGVLAAVLATPCTAPFLASAMAFAFSQPPWVIILFFLAVGAGLALPFVALCWEPAWLKYLPKPGDWMVGFKQAMGFPMLATTVWLFWPTAPRLGENGVLWFGLFLVAVAASAWIWGEFSQRGNSRPRLAMGISVAVLALAYFGLMEKQLDWRTPAARKKPKLAWQKWSPAAVAEARSKGHPVMVDFTAQTCFNCKWNKSRAIEIPETIQRIESTKTIVFQADFTDEDPEIATELRSHGRSGVPMVLVYSPKTSTPPRVLPVILKGQIVQDALEWAVKN